MTRMDDVITISIPDEVSPQNVAVLWMHLAGRDATVLLDNGQRWAGWISTAHEGDLIGHLNARGDGDNFKAVQMDLREVREICLGFVHVDEVEEVEMVVDTDTGDESE